MQLVGKLSSNPERFGSRLGFIAFADNWKPARMGKFRLSEKDIHINGKIARQIFRRVSDVAARLVGVKEVQAFLESEDKEYTATLLKKAEEARLDKSTRDLLVSFKEGFKHQKGIAFKEGLITYFIEHRSEAIRLLESDTYEPDAGKVLEICLSEWQNIKQLQLRMVQKFISGAQNMQIFVDEYPKYLRSLLIGLARWLKKHEVQKTRLVVFEELGEYLEKDTTYKDIGTIVSIFPKNLERLNRLLYDLEISIIRKDGTHYLEVRPETAGVFEENKIESRLVSSIIDDIIALNDSIIQSNQNQSISNEKPMISPSTKNPNKPRKTKSTADLEENAE